MVADATDRGYLRAAIRHSGATVVIRLLRFLTIIATGSCWQTQPPGPFGRRARPYPLYTVKSLTISVVIFDEGCFY
jgi:hypothetical protein